MERRTCPRGLLYSLVAFALLLVAFICPGKALAANSYVAYSLSDSGMPHPYMSVDAAIQAGYSGKVIYLSEDWELTNTLGIADSKSITIEMNGHVIRNVNSNAEVFRLFEHSSLTLTGVKQPDHPFTFKGYDGSAKQIDIATTRGGLVTGGGGESGAFRMDADSKLTLENVLVAGNKATGSGGAAKIYGKGCTITMTGARMDYNYSENGGGGISVFGKKATVSMKASTISYNYAEGNGGALYSNCSDTSVSMEQGSKIEGNVADGCGAGIYFNYSCFSLTSGDKTALIASNSAKSSGGGLMAAAVTILTNRGSVSGITFNQNSSGSDGGAMAMGQSNVTIKDCVMQKNKAAHYGGAVYSGATTTFQDCSVTENTCGNEGGAVYVHRMKDLKVKGKVTVKDNKRTDGADDDVFLEANALNTVWAYVVGTPDKGSEIGIRTNTSGNRRVVTELNSYTEGMFFLNEGGSYHLEYSTGDKELFQRKGAYEYLVTINGEGTTRYAYGTTVNVNGAPSDPTKYFKCWTSETTGITLTDEQKKSKTLSFKMTTNDVHLKAEYGTRATVLKVNIDWAVPGEKIPTQTNEWSIGSDEKQVAKDNIAVVWKEKQSDGSFKPVSGTFKYNTTYKAELVIQENCSNDIAFSNDKLRVRLLSGQMDVFSSYHLDPSTGNCYVYSEEKTTSKPFVNEIYPASVSVDEGMSYEEFKGCVPSKVVALTSNGSKVYIEVNWALLSASCFPELFEDGKVVKLSDPLTLGLPVTSTEFNIDATDDFVITIKVNPKSSERAADVTNALATGADAAVTVADAVEEGGDTAANASAIEMPHLSLEQGEYSTHEQPSPFDANGKLYATASCATAGAVIKYKQSYCDDEWTMGEETTYKNPLEFSCNKDGQRFYMVEIWAESADGTQESNHDYWFYELDDIDASAYVDVELTCDCGGAKEVESLNVVKGDDLYYIAPAKDGYGFIKWDWADAPEGFDATDPVLSIENLTEDVTITAVYYPALTEFDLGMAPPAAGETLATELSGVKGIVAGKEVDLGSLFDLSKVSWSPVEPDGIATYMTSYVAAIPLASNDSVIGENPNSSMLDTVAIKCNGQSVTGASSWFAKDEDGQYTLYVSFPETGKIKATGVVEPDALELSFEQAVNYQNSGSWELPSEVGVSLEGDMTIPVDVAWDAVTGFDIPNYSAQTVTVKGKVNFPQNYIDQNGVSDQVTLTIKVTEPVITSVPTADVVPGTYSEAQYVYFSCDTPGAEFYYTTDGTTPTENSATCTDGGIKVTKPTTIRVVAQAQGMLPSETSVFAYKIAGTDKAVQKLKVTPAKKVFKVAKVKKAAKKYSLKVRGAKGELSYSIAKAAKKAGIFVSAKGKVTVKKGTKKGVYKITVKAAKTRAYKAASKTVKVVVK